LKPVDKTFSIPLNGVVIVASSTGYMEDSSGLSIGWSSSSMTPNDRRTRTKIGNLFSIIV